MKVTLNWLKRYVDFDWSPEELAERLTMLGIEVERVDKLTGEFEKVVVAQILSSEKHPNADTLSVCRVADGQGERQIVCGAKNYKVGDKVPLALPGCTLPSSGGGTQSFTIKVSKMRGIESQGMMCSPKELGLAEDASGLMILPADAKVGVGLAEHLGRSGGDVVYDLEITPNRADLNSVIGIAREISALTGNPLRLPDLGAANAQPAAEKAAELVQVRIEDPDLCPRYIARVIKGVKVGPSPDWLRYALELVGVRSINNIVDVTNYVMLESGQPLHAFDYHLIQPVQGHLPCIVVRRAHADEKITTLDGQERPLPSEALLIADESKAIALAGIMGGQNSEINEATVDVLLESASFKASNIRATSKRLDLRTDASYRFERGGDAEICEWASRRAVQLILEVAGGQLAEGAVDAYPSPATPKEVTLRPDKVRAVLGVDIPRNEQSQYLQRLGLELLESTNEPEAALHVRIPSSRLDLKREIDLVEEIARLYGVDRIPSTPPRGAIGTHPHDKMHDNISEARRVLTGLGLFEAQGQTLISDKAAELANASSVPSEKNGGTPSSVSLANPLSSEMNVLRPSLLPGLMDALRHNLHHKNNTVALFEIGKVFQHTSKPNSEALRVAMALTGERPPRFWTGEDRQAKYDLFDLKGILEEFFDQYGVRGLGYSKRPEPNSLYIESAVIQIGKQPVGQLGQVLPPLARHYDLRDPVFLAEIDLDLLLARRSVAKGFKPLPAFPTIRRDIAMVLPEELTHDAVLAAVRQAKVPNLESSELFDVFRGKNVPAGHKSVAYAFTYRHAERTLTDTEVNAAHERLVVFLKQTLKATVRE